MQTALVGFVAASLSLACFRSRFPFFRRPPDGLNPTHSYAPLIERLTKEGKPMLLLPELQEVNDLPCDTGSVSPHRPSDCLSSSSSDRERETNRVICAPLPFLLTPHSHPPVSHRPRSPPRIRLPRLFSPRTLLVLIWRRAFSLVRRRGVELETRDLRSPPS